MAINHPALTFYAIVIYDENGPMVHLTTTKPQNAYREARHLVNLYGTTEGIELFRITTNRSMLITDWWNKSA